MHWRLSNPKIDAVIRKVPTSQQGDVFDAVKRAFNAGYVKGRNHEQKDSAPIEVGGVL